MIKIIDRKLDLIKAKRLFRPFEIGDFVSEEKSITLTRVVDGIALEVNETEVGGYATLLSEGSVDLSDGKRITIRKGNVTISTWKDV